MASRGGSSERTSGGGRARRTYVLSKQREKWSAEEQALFEQAIARFWIGDKLNADWKTVAQFIPTKTVVQIRSHAQKHFLKLAKQQSAGGQQQAAPRHAAQQPHQAPPRASRAQSPIHQEHSPLQIHAQIKRKDPDFNPFEVESAAGHWAKPPLPRGDPATDQWPELPTSGPTEEEQPTSRNPSTGSSGERRTPAPRGRPGPQRSPDTSVNRSGMAGSQEGSARPHPGVLSQAGQVPPDLESPCSVNRGEFVAQLDWQKEADAVLGSLMHARALPATAEEALQQPAFAGPLVRAQSRAHSMGAHMSPRASQACRPTQSDVLLQRGLSAPTPQTRQQAHQAHHVTEQSAQGRPELLTPAAEAFEAAADAPDFALIYAFLGSFFDPLCAIIDQADVLEQMTPLDRETSLLLMNNLVSNMQSPQAWHDHIRMLQQTIPPATIRRPHAVH